MTDERNQEIMNGTYDKSEVDTLDKFFAYTQSEGSIAQAGSDTLYGFNQTRKSGIIPANRDTQGFVFFTRPMLNLSESNLIRHRDFHTLATNDSNSVQSYVRCTLDPSLRVHTKPNVRCDLMDNKQVFIPLLSNTLLKLSGWPDSVVPVYTSKQGTRKEQWAIADGTNEVNEVFDIDATFRNMADEPASLLFKTWTTYQSCVFDGQLKPYPGFEARNEIDYTTRIYRLVMDSTERFVKKIACTIASFPINEPTGKFFDYDRAQQYMDQTKELNIRFKCMGAKYNDEIIIKWFNRAGTYANGDLLGIIESGFDPESNSHNYEVIPRELLSQFKHRGYPLINTDTYELQWWISKESPSWKRVVNGTNSELGSSSLLNNLEEQAKAELSNAKSRLNNI